MPSAFAAETETARRLWYWRDLDGMATALLGPARSKALPFFLDAEASPAPTASQPRTPQGGTTRLEIPNRHLEYALTWYGLALSLIRQRRFDEALIALRKNTELQPMSPYGWYQLARVHVDRQEPDEAAKIIRHLRKFEPKVAAQLERETGLGQARA